MYNVYFNNGRYHVSNKTISYKTDSEIVNDKVIGLEGIDYWKNFEKEWNPVNDFTIVEIKDIEVDETVLKRVDIVNSLPNLTSDIPMVDHYINTGELSKTVDDLEIRVQPDNPLYKLIEINSMNRLEETAVEITMSTAELFKNQTSESSDLMVTIAELMQMQQSLIQEFEEIKEKINN